MKICKFCKSEINNEATVCPFCRKQQIDSILNQKISGLQILFIIVIFILSLIFLPKVINIFDSKETSYTIINGEKVTKDFYSRNETITCQKGELSITHVQEKTSKDYDYITSGEKLVAITYKIKNNDDSDKTYYSSDFELVTSSGEIKQPKSAVFTNMWSGEFLSTPTLAPNGEKEGYHVYLLDENESNYYIKYHCSYNLDFSETYIKIRP